MDLLRDVLDKQLVDRHGVKMGKVDGIVAELRRDGPPRVVAIEVGAIVMARRFGQRPQQWTTWLASKLGGEVHSRPHRVAWSTVRDVGVDLKLDVAVSDTAIFDWQDWLRDRVVSKIPGA
ncbi:hypothetical protein FHS26_006407 [Rhizobium pisi]|uniref:PRC-barrel domain-containing protein n=3 Tax=Rhizobium TaxID=379 RepID=A0A7W6B7X5_9HYPH|nr:hypothetical protein [Rhizobium pisi]MBB3917318.1 hypothetical protein [Rhizobium fabae]MBB3138628.1 hypothetical protein [Rhizobium pisi]RSB62074.1 hypothetical protein EFD55_30015 [Rhizobium pisi]RUM10226.1 hypothetical protein EFB14_23465 [Rhizobium fabae]TCA43028.1 hypothetical protein E0J16_32610 [Rhizobium pisi]